VKAKSHVLEERKRQLWQEIVNPLETKIARLQEESADAQEGAERAMAEVKPSENWDMQISGVEKLIKQQSNRIEEITHKGLKDNETCPTCYGVVDSKNAVNVIKAIEAERLKLQLQHDDLVAKKLADLTRVNRKRTPLPRR
jgi:hypothetical protein